MEAASTLLAALWSVDGDEDIVVRALETGALTLTGNFKGHEAAVAAQAREIN